VCWLQAYLFAFRICSAMADADATQLPPSRGPASASGPPEEGGDKVEGSPTQREGEAKASERGDNQEAANAVSLLQEYVQSCTSFSPHRKILTWNFNQQLENDTTLQFKATVSFMFNTIPHHFCGGWQSSKKKAQRDTAERVRHYLARSFAQPGTAGAGTALGLLQDPLHGGAPGTAAAPLSVPDVTAPAAAQAGAAAATLSGGTATNATATATMATATSSATTAAQMRPQDRPRPQGPRAAIDPTNLPRAVVTELRAAVSGKEDVAYEKLRWKLEDQSSTASAEDKAAGRVFRATVSFFIHTIPHHFAGIWCSSEQEARAELAERVLWYFGKAEGFAVTDKSSAQESLTSGTLGALPARLATSTSPMSPASSSAAVSPPNRSSGPAAVVDTSSANRDAANKSVEDKTILMQVQNALQKSFARETPPGQRVWVWSYEADQYDPQLFRAHVEVPCWNETFIGEWCRGKKLAQRSACLVVKSELEKRAAAA